ncbi:MAG TPA: sulfotransferase domain-containing protein, partial [Telmatospirillum sp.]|nr:sulfotransferase domain-containing protein [Telmatospirillum sp.]
MTGGRFGWLVSYPKSGNTWLRLMLSSLLSGGESVDINAPAVRTGIATFSEMDEFLGIESSELTDAEIADARPALHAAFAATNTEPLLLRKVHERFWHTPSGAAVFVPKLSAGAVYLIRDPRDVAISWSYHYGIGIDQVIESMADDDIVLARSETRASEQLPQPLGSWSGHALSWLEQTEIPVLVIRYEDMLREALAPLTQVATHLGITTTPALLDLAVETTRFEILSAQEKTHGFRERLSSATAPFFREGRSGGWRERLSAAQIDRIINRHKAVMA